MTTRRTRKGSDQKPTKTHDPHLTLVTRQHVQHTHTPLQEEESKTSERNRKETLNWSRRGCRDPSLRDSAPAGHQTCHQDHQMKKVQKLVVHFFLFLSSPPPPIGLWVHACAVTFINGSTKIHLLLPLQFSIVMVPPATCCTFLIFQDTGLFFFFFLNELK